MNWQRPPSDHCLSNLAIDRLLGRELDEEGRRAARDHLADCPRCSARLDQLEAERAEFRRSPPLIALPSPVVRRRPPAMALAAAGALSAAFALALFIRGAGPPGAPAGEGTRSKGTLRLGIFIKRGDTVLPGRGGDVVHPGDAIRFTYSSVDRGYLAIVGRDGAGRVSVYFPDGAETEAITAADQELLPGSIVLDDVLGPEEIHAVHCRAPMPVARIRQSLERGESLLAPGGCTVDRLILDKRP